MADAEADTTPRLSRADLLREALAIAKEYRSDNLTLTLRQMYYQLVARGLSPNGQKHYKRIGDVLTQARYDGEYPLDWLVDRGRSVRDGDYTRNDLDVARSLEDATDWVKALPQFLMQTARWYGQSTYVSVWVEKEALSEVFEQVCDELGVSWFACKGYPSVSALWEFLRLCRASTRGAERDPSRYSFGDTASWRERHAGTATQVVVLYFGDHDPDGWEIPRSAERNLATLQRIKKWKIPIRFERLALSMEQIEEYDPPPFPAKTTSSRYAKYFEEHDTNSAWELDALEPRVLRDLIRAGVTDLFDAGVHEDQQDYVRNRQAELRECMQQPAFITEALEDADEDDYDDE